MAEENQVQQVTMKDPKKVAVGKRLAEHNTRLNIFRRSMRAHVCHLTTDPLQQKLRPQLSLPYLLSSVFL